MRRAGPAGLGALAGLVTFAPVGIWAGAWLGWFAAGVVGLLTTHLAHMLRAAASPTVDSDPGPLDLGQPPPPAGRGWRWDFEGTDTATAAGYPHTLNRSVCPTSRLTIVHHVV